MTARDSWLGIDLGGTYIKWEHVADDGQVIETGRVATPTAGQVEVSEAVAGIYRDRKAHNSSVAGWGLAIPGHLTPARDAITLLPNVAGQWPGFPLNSFLQERTGVAPVLLNDARAFALAEMKLGSARHQEEVLFATIGTGIGGAVAVGGSVVSSNRDTFGEIGHTTAVLDGEPCGCGGRGCVEAYAGGSYVLSRARARGMEIMRGPTALIALAAEAGSNPVAAQVLQEAYEAFAVGITTVCSFTGSALVVVGGAVADELPAYLDFARTHLAGRELLLGRVEVRAATLGSRAGALGAALAAKSHRSRRRKELVDQR